VNGLTYKNTSAKAEKIIAEKPLNPFHFPLSQIPIEVDDVTKNSQQSHLLRIAKSAGGNEPFSRTQRNTPSFNFATQPEGIHFLNIEEFSQSSHADLIYTVACVWIYIYKKASGVLN
jgi:hypothetical protein